MSKAIRRSTLTDRELLFADQMSTIATWLATPGNTDARVVELVVSTYEVDERAAKVLCEKGKEWLSLGVPEQALRAKAMYVKRLEMVMEKTLPHVVKDTSETVVKVKQAPVEHTSDDGVTTTGTADVTETTTKFKQNVYDAAAAGVFLKAAKELAIMTGGRDADGPTHVSQTVVAGMITSGQNLPGARLTAQLTNERLLAMAGVVGDYDDVEILSEPAAYEESAGAEEGEGAAAADAGNEA